MGFLFLRLLVDGSERGGCQKEDVMNIEELARIEKLNELDILRQSLEDKDKRVWELEKRVELLEGMLNHTAAFQGRLPQPQPLPAIRTQPRRWSVR
jgi:hypothetical protein